MSLRQKWIDMLRELTDAAESVEQNWEQGNLAQSVTTLSIVAGEAREMLNEWDAEDNVE